jgi:hypothetical protein
MRVTIVTADGFVSVDGVGYHGINLSFMDDNINAVQWYDTEGEVERKDKNGRITTNETINDLTPFQPAIDAWEIADVAAKEALEALKALEESN